VVATAAASVATVNEAQVTATDSTTARSLADRFADVVNVLDYGAVGDGVTDDKNAIKAAIEKALLTGSVCYIPDGNYFMSTSITVNGNDGIVNIVGSGEIQAPYSNDIEDNTQRSDSEILAGIYFTNFKDVTIDGIKIRGSFFANIGCDSFKLLNVRARNLHNALMPISGEIQYILLDNCLVEYAMDSSSGNYGALNYNAPTVDSGSILVKNTDFYGISSCGTLDAPLKNVVYDGCKFIGIDVNCLKTTHVKENYIVSNCYFDATPINPSSSNRHLQGSYGVCGLFLNAFSNLVVENSIFTNFGKSGTVDPGNSRVMQFFDGSQYNSNAVIKNCRFIDNERNILHHPHGHISVKDCSFTRSNIVTGEEYALKTSSLHRVNTIRFENNYISNGIIDIDRDVSYTTNLVRVKDNTIINDGDVIGDNYSISLNYQLRSGNVFVDDNTLTISNGTKVLNNAKGNQNFITNPTSDVGFTTYSADDRITFDPHSYIDRNMNPSDTLTMYSNAKLGTSRGRMFLCVATNTTSSNDTVMEILGWDEITDSVIDRTITNVNNSGSFSFSGDDLIFTCTAGALRVWSFSVFPVSSN
jgi:hypothetical protein